jgi:hypothetical protein
MLNKKFASIRATANVKTEKRSSVASSSNNMMMNQRLSQSQSMEMYGGINYHHQQQQANNDILMNITKESSHRSATPSQYDHQQRILINSSPATPTRNVMMMKSSPHPYVNLMHQQYHNNSNTSPHQHLQYQNNSNNTSAMSYGSPIMIDNSSQNQSWSSLSLNQQPSPATQHYTAAQIYMRPKNYKQQPNAQQPQLSPQFTQQQQQVSPSPKVTHKKVPPEVPKRMPSTVSTTSIKKQNGLSRSGMIINIVFYVCIA